MNPPTASFSPQTATAQEANPTSPRDGARRVLLARFAVAGVQAAGLYVLAEAAAAPHSWPATQPALFDPLLLAFAAVPLLVLVGLGQMRAHALIGWAAVAVAAVSLLGWWDQERGRVAAFPGQDLIWPSIPLVAAVLASLFVGHALVVDAISQRRWRALYARHFDTAWTMGVQLAFAAGFVLVFWGVLELGAALFRLVDVGLPGRIIEKRWFAIPATTLALAGAIHLTDVQPALIRGARSLGLALLSWLLPLLALILLAFLAGLLFISLAPLWRTHFAASLLLVAAGALVLLVNCNYQDGAQEMVRSRWRQHLATLAALELAPLVGLAAWALKLRVNEYGWTGERVMACAVILLAACYALGYAGAALRTALVRGQWLRGIETVNFTAAYLSLALALALFTPVADPARIMVADQVARLRSGAVDASHFDYRALRFDGARWGAAALTGLAATREGPDASLIATRARAAIEQRMRYGVQGVSPEEYADRVDVFPKGRALPGNLLVEAAGGTDAWRLTCLLRPGAQHCSARYFELAPGREAILVLDILGTQGVVYEADATGHWRVTAHASVHLECPPRAPFAAPPEVAVLPAPLPDLRVGDRTIHLTPNESPATPKNC
jgi:hypothetical protein